MITVVMPDTGPLISLSLAGRLDLLNRFKGQILIADAVRYELFGGRVRTPDQDSLATWLASIENRIRVFETTYGSMLREIAELRQALPAEECARLPRDSRTRNAGKFAILEMASSLRTTLTRDATGLVLFEDRRVETMDFGPYVRRMSTWSFPLALESLKVIPSAASLFDQIHATGRTLDRYPFDQFSSDINDDFRESYDTTQQVLPSRSADPLSRPDGIVQLAKDKAQDLHAAIKSGDIDRVRSLLADGRDPNIPDTSVPSGSASPLYLAAVHGHLDIIQALVSAGADVDIKNAEGWTPLHYAAHYAAPGMVQTLLNAGADPNVQGPDDSTALHWAMRHRNPQDAAAILEALLDDGADPTVKDNKGRTPLMIGETNPLLGGTGGLTRLREVTPKSTPKPRDSGSSCEP